MSFICQELVKDIADTLMTLLTIQRTDGDDNTSNASSMFEFGFEMGLGLHSRAIFSSTDIFSAADLAKLAQLSKINMQESVKPSPGLSYVLSDDDEDEI
jgi:hypothetical protein